MMHEKSFSFVSVTETRCAGELSFLPLPTNIGNKLYRLIMLRSLNKKKGQLDATLTVCFFGDIAG